MNQAANNLSSEYNFTAAQQHVCTSAGMIPMPRLSQSFNKIENASPAVHLRKRKYIKKEKLKYMSMVQVEKGQVNMQKSSRLLVQPMYNSIQDKLDFILIGGDFLFRVTAKKESMGSYQDFSYKNINNDMDLFGIYKQIQSIQTSECAISVSMSNKIQGLKDFRFMIQAINETLFEISGQNSYDLLLEFQEAVFQCTSTINQIIDRYQNPDDLIRLQKMRADYISNVGEAYIRSHYEETDFIGIGMVMIDFDKKTPTLQSLVFNKALVSLIGTDMQQLERYFLRKGIHSFFDFRTRVLMQHYHIQGVLNRNNQKFSLPFTLITFDSINVPCEIEVETVFIELPEPLKYIPMKENPFEVVEGGFVMRIVLQPSQIEQILEIRKTAIVQTDSNSISNLTNMKESDIGYDIQAQYLIEKFYSQPYSANLETSVEEQEDENQEAREINSEIKDLN